MSSPAARLGLYGGTFDPIHHGHLILARDAMELLNLDRVIFIPAAISPHKLASTPAPAQLRRDMVAAAIADDPAFAVDDLELHRSGPSFTIDTVEEMESRHAGAELFYFIGYDNIAELHTWRRIDELRQKVQLIVFDRHENAVAHPHPSLRRRIDISATEIRQRVAQRQSIRYLVPEPVRAIIQQHHLYQESSPSIPNS
jgi:nicotinate-nucleotide adenylyltransferase